MAKIKPTAAIAEIRGKLAGSVFQKGKAGLIIRNQSAKKQATNRNIDIVRIAYKKCLDGWKSLDEGRRQRWRNMADYYTFNNVFGDSKKLSGLQYYCKVNMPPAINNFQLRSDPVFPQRQEFSTVSSILLLSSGTIMVVDRSPSAFTNQVYHQFYAARKVPNSVRPHTLKYTYMATYFGNMGNPASSGCNYNRLWGAPLSGSGIWWKCIVIMGFTGQQAEPQYIFQ